MKLIVFATLLEARATLEALQSKDSHFKQINETLYHFYSGKIVISGMGISKALATTLHYGQDVDTIYNLGFAGAIDDSLKIGSIYFATDVSKNLILPPDIDETSRQIAHRIHPLFDLDKEDANGKKLISSDYPLFKDKAQYKNYDLVDLEGYGIAMAASFLNKRARLIKIISDFANDQGRHSIEKQGALLSTALKNFVFEHLT